MAFTHPLEKILQGLNLISLHQSSNFSSEGDSYRDRIPGLLETPSMDGKGDSNNPTSNPLSGESRLGLEMDGGSRIESPPKPSGKRVLVVKFGGSVLRDASSIKRAAEAVKGEYERGISIIVVVSAMKGVTDRLISMAKTISPHITQEDLDDILAMGEEESARLMTTALRGQGLDAIEVTPKSPLWPIITDEGHGDAEPLQDPSRERARGLLTLLEEGRIPVICGFVGRSRTGRATTLGRGGSDTTAMLLANYLEADELVLVKDVNGIFSADPDKVRDPRHIESLDVEEAYILSSGGARVLHSKSFKYKPEKLQVRLVSLGESLTQGGTLIKNGAIPGLKVILHGKPIHMLTLVGDPISDLNTMTRIHSEVEGAGGRLISLTLKDKAAILYFEGDPVKILERVHEAIRSSKHLKALSQYEDLTMVIVYGVGLETTPGLIKRVAEPLARDGINIYGLLTIASSVSILVDRRYGEEICAMIKESLEHAQTHRFNQQSQATSRGGRE